jgi:hypothetical protein
LRGVGIRLVAQHGDGVEQKTPVADGKNTDLA